MGKNEMAAQIAAGLARMLFILSNVRMRKTKQGGLTSKVSIIVSRLKY